MVSESNKIGLLPAILMVAGNMMGSGVFMLPANLAGIGSIAIIGWLITVVGAIALGLVFAKLTEVTTAAGGPYAYARKASAIIWAIRPTWSTGWPTLSAMSVWRWPGSVI